MAALPPAARASAAAAATRARCRTEFRGARARVRALQRRPRLDAARGAASPRAPTSGSISSRSSYGRAITRLDQIPDEELDTLARRGLHRAVADRRVGAQPRLAAHQAAVRQPRGGRLGVLAVRLRRSPPTWAARRPARTCATAPGARGIRLASDMVPNHMGIDSRWVIEHPDWFVQLDHSPYPVYRFNGPDLSATTARRHLHRGPLLRPHRRGGGVQARRPLDRRRPLHLPRQRRHQHAVERHRAARLPASPRCARR